jgi:hypothetical protein
LHDGWKENWRALAPSTDARIDLPRRGGVRAAADELRDLAPGVQVAICASGFGALRRVRKCARRAELVGRREYLAFPTVEAPAYLIEDSSSSVEYFFDTVATVPPGVATLEGAANVGLRALRVASRSRLLRALIPGRILVGSRP